MMNIVQLVTGPLSVNTWFIPLGENRVVIVDPGGDADLIIAHLEESGSVPVAFALTHGHFDHLIALPELVRTFPGLPIAIHEADSLFLGPGALERHLAFFTAIGGASLVKRYGEILPGATGFFRDGDDLNVAFTNAAFGNAPSVNAVSGWKVIHTPGHSKGSVCLYNEGEGILISGDTLFNAGVGRTDAPDGSSTELDSSLLRLSKLDANTVVLPGHGMRTRIGDELR
jgi:glyoxylase-like metal-dependent hydrolase (beta-lactamase superfamily II)